MKLIKILILLLFVASLFPADVFCSDHAGEMDDQHHCLMICQNCCYSDALPISSISALNIPQIPQNSCNLSFFYQEPFLDVAGRPPTLAG